MASYQMMGDTAAPTQNLTNVMLSMMAKANTKIIPVPGVQLPSVQPFIDSIALNTTPPTVKVSQESPISSRGLSNMLPIIAALGAAGLMAMMFLMNKKRIPAGG
jgi:hypothetical protein